MVTYNHAEFLGEAIESVLAQDFVDWELVIGEDCSTDDTLAVARSYAERDPKRIRVLSGPENLGGRGNFIRTLSACRGEYVAQLDGDDYWTAPDKLSRQVAFLDAHPDAALVFSACEMVGEGAADEQRIFRAPGRKERYEQRELLQGNLMSSCAVLWRRPAVESYPPWFLDVPVGDWAVHLLVADGGWIGYEDRVESAHRTHAGGMWGSMGELHRLEQRLKVRPFLLEHLGPKAEPDARAADLRDRFRIAREWARMGRHREAAEHFAWCWRHRGDGRRPAPYRSLLGLLRTRAASALGLQRGESDA